VLGDLEKNSFGEIWNGAEYRISGVMSLTGTASVR
jgi:hypothetical protein